MMTNIRRYLLLLVALAATVGAMAQNSVVFEANIPNHIIAGEPFSIQFTVNASTKDIEFELPEGLEYLYGPAKGTSSSMRIINGKRTSSKSTSFTYTFMAGEEGNYIIPEASVVVDGATYRTSSVRIKVFAADTDTEIRQNHTGTGISDSDLYIVAIPDKTKVYEQEAVQITYKLYSRLENPQFTNFSFPDYEGFVQYVQDDGSHAQFQAEEVNGKLYYTAPFYSVIVYPQHSGKLEIQPAEFEMVVNMPVSNPQRSLFDAFFDNFQQVKKSIKTKPITIEVKPLPTPQPESFNGAVGQYTLNSEVSSKVLKTNESITIKLTLEGKGNIKLAQLPDVVFPEGFETYDPKESDDTGISGGNTRGSKSKEYYAVPKHTGDFTIPEIPFSYFDPKQGSYQTVTLPEIKVHVDKGESSGATTVTGLPDKEDVKYLGKDIRYLKSGNRITTPTQSKRSAYIGGYIALALSFAVLLVIVRKREAANADTATNRSRKAGKTAQKYLKIANRMRSKGEASAYYEALLKGLSDFLSAKFHIPLSEMSKDNISDTMLRSGVNRELADEAIDTLSALELARYTPSEMEERAQLYDRAAKVIEGVQKTKLKK
ncbi:MAG: BatD family protein [Porphyromonas sp.]|nr:BatD family protein [Porphyromonas sp.]